CAPGGTNQVPPSSRADTHRTRPRKPWPRSIDPSVSLDQGQAKEENDGPRPQAREEEGGPEEGSRQEPSQGQVGEGAAAHEPALARLSASAASLRRRSRIRSAARRGWTFQAAGGSLGDERGGENPMSDDALFVGWGEVVRGRERKAVEVFNEAIEYYSKLQQEGKIDSVEPWFLATHGGDLG